jgi:hypothetical protein
MKIKHLLLILFVSSSIAGFGQTMTLTGQDSTNSQIFKTTAGSDRTVVFGQLKHLIVAKSGNHTSSNLTSVFTSKTEIISLLGPPDFLRGTQLLGYYLNAINGPCMVVFGYNQSDIILYYSIYDCN